MGRGGAGEAVREWQSRQSTGQEQGRTWGLPSQGASTTTVFTPLLYSVAPTTPTPTTSPPPLPNPLPPCRYYINWLNASLNGQPLDTAGLMRIRDFALPGAGVLRLDYVSYRVRARGGVGGFVCSTQTAVDCQRIKRMGWSRSFLTCCRLAAPSPFLPGPRPLTLQKPGPDAVPASRDELAELQAVLRGINISHIAAGLAVRRIADPPPPPPKQEPPRSAHASRRK